MTTLWKKYAISLCFSAIFLFSVDGRADNADDLMKKGESALRNKSYASAADYFDQAAKAAQTSFKRARATFLKGLVFYSLGQFHQAIDQFERAQNQLKSDVSTPERLNLDQEIQFYIGQSYFGLQHWGDAISHFDRSIGFNRNPDILFKSNLLANRARRYRDENIGRVSKLRLFADGGILFDSNVILETAGEEKVRHDDVALLNVEAKEAYAAFLGVVPLYERPVFRRSSFQVSGPLRGQHYISNSMEDFDFFSFSPDVALETPRTLWNHPLKLRNGFTYSTSFAINTEPIEGSPEHDEKIDQIVNSYIGHSSAQFFYSDAANTTLGANLGYIDNKEGDGSTKGRDGIFLKGRLAQELGWGGVHWFGGYSIAALKRTGKLNQYLRQELVLGADFKFFFETEMALEALGYYTDFPRNTFDRKEHGGILSGRWTKMFGERLGTSVSGFLSKNRARRVSATYERLGAAIGLFYLYE